MTKIGNTQETAPTATTRDDDADTVIFCYTRREAIEDGVLIDVTPTAQEAGIKHPTALTAAVWAQYVRVPEGVAGQDEQGRLWDILWMLRSAIVTQDREGGSELNYSLLVRNNNQRPDRVQLKAICGPGDRDEPVITILLPHED